MIKRKKQIITQGYKTGHKAVDLRSVSFFNWKLQPVITPERCKVTAKSTDHYGNDFLIVSLIDNPYYSRYEFIHVSVFSHIQVGQTLDQHTKIGYTQIKGNSKAHHLHVEISTEKETNINPLDYYDYLGIDYKFKKGLRDGRK